MTLADSATVISAETYRFTDHPERVRAAQQGLAQIGSLPCGILITPHPGASALFARMVKKTSLANRDACRTYADAAKLRLAKRLKKEAGQ